MDLKHLLYMAVILGMIPAVSAVLIYSHKARQGAIFLMAFSTIYVYQLQITFFGRIWYRGTSRGYEVSIIDILAIGLLIAMLVRPKKGQGKFFWPAGMAPLVVYLIFCFGRSIFADPIIFGWWEVYKILKGMLIICVVAWYIRSETELSALLLGMACAVIWEGIASLKMRYIEHAFRISGTIDHPNSLSMYMCLCAPIMYSACLTKGLPKWTQRFCAVGAVLAMIGVILTISRAGFVTWCLISLAVTVACVSTKLTIKKVAISIVVLAMVGGAIGYSWKTLEKRLVEETNFDEELDPDNLGRGSYFRLAKLIVSERFWGVGFNNWSWYVTNEYQAKDNPKLKYKPYISTGDGLDDYPDLIPMYKMETAQAAPAHNLGALTIGELGYVGLAIFVIVWVRWFDMGQRFLWKRSPELMHRMGTGFFFAVCAVFLQSLTEWEFRQPPIFYMFHLSVGGLAALYRYRKLPKAKKAGQQKMVLVPVMTQPAAAIQGRVVGGTPAR